MRQIIFERQGGFMGRKISMSLDLDGLPLEQKRVLARLMADADLFALPSQPGLTPNPDAFIYNLTITMGERTHEVHTTDEAAPDSLRPLLEELTRMAKARRIENK